MKYEEILIYDIESSVYKSREAIVKLIQANSNIRKFEDGLLEIDDKKINLRIDFVKNESRTTVSLCLAYSVQGGGDESADSLLLAIREVRKSLPMVKGPSAIIWDDISLYYSNKSYKLIHRLENVMRKLIGKFLLTKIGTLSESIPDDVLEGVQGDQRKSINILQEVNFDKLKDILFSINFPKNQDEVFSKIKRSSTIKDLNIEEIKEILPKSNWEKYFNSLVDLEDGQINSKWKSIYEVRNKVAHNKKMRKDDFERIEKIYNELYQSLNEASDKIVEMDEVSGKDSQDFILDLTDSPDSLIGNFLETLDRVVQVSEVVLNNYSISRTPKTFGINSVVELLNIGVLERSEMVKVLEANKMKNIFVYEGEFELKDIMILNFTKSLIEIEEKLRKLI